MYYVPIIYKHLCCLCIKSKHGGYRRMSGQVSFSVILSYFLNTASLKEHGSKLVTGMAITPPASILPYSVRVQVNLAMPGFLCGFLGFEHRALFLHKK